MRQITTRASFPLMPALAWLSGIVVVGTVGALALAVQLRVAGFVGAVALISAGVSLLPVRLLGPAGVTAAVWGYFVGAIGRLLLCLGMAMVGVLVLRMPAAAVMVLMVGLYLPMLAVEAALVGRYLWAKDAPACNSNREVRA